MRSNHTHGRRPLKKNAVRHFTFVGRTPSSAKNVQEPLYFTLLRFKVAPNSTYCSDDSINVDGNYKLINLLLHPYSSNLNPQLDVASSIFNLTKTGEISLHNSCTVVSLERSPTRKVCRKNITYSCMKSQCLQGPYCFPCKSR